MKKLLIRKCKIKDSLTILKIFNESVNKGLTGTRKKIKYCDYLIVNNKSKNILKKKVNDIIK